MKRPILILAYLLSFSALSYGQLKVSFDYDGDTDFRQFTTYAFTDRAKNLDISDIAQDRLLEALTGALSKKGLTQSEDPDLLVEIHLSVAEKTRTTATTDHMGGPGGWYGPGYRYGWGASFSTTTINEYDYLEGTIFIDLINAKTEKLVWQGRGVGTVKPNASTAQKEKRAKKGAAKIFKKYPPK